MKFAAEGFSERNSLKGTARAKRGKSVRQRVVCVVQVYPVPGNWTSFLKVDENKTELLIFISDAHYDSADKKMMS